MNSTVYQKILKENVRPSVRQLKLKRSWVLQQDNDPKHTSKSTSEWLKKNKMKTLEWPSQSPDLNPIEMLWHDLKKAVHARKPSNKAELQQFCKDESVGNDSVPVSVQDVVWADFGFPGRDGKESSLWVGSSGANTPCHVDSYGCNLVLQVQGRKTWHLYPPGDTPHMYPTRIPYEESSIFSKVNVVNPDRSRFPLFSRTSPHVVTLHPGQVLLVPRHWWHYVQSVDDMTVSINSWIELDSDHESRVQEAVTRTLVCLFKSADPCSPPDWLNPTEDEVPTHQTNLRDLSRAVGAYTEYQREKQWSRDSRTGNSGPKRRRTEGEVEAAGDKPLPSAPFGPHLSPVAPTPPEPNVGRAEYCSADAQQNVTIETLPKACDSHARQLGSDRTISSEEVLDCLVDPQVIRLVTELLLQRLSP
uniref:JmjC domain-containing protein n=1 Tax=Xenopus tropicalis TaxID=8364 RepID=A0A1B8Y1H7_XENTR